MASTVTHIFKFKIREGSLIAFGIVELTARKHDQRSWRDDSSSFVVVNFYEAELDHFWNYDSNKDSVLQVSKRDYVTCNTSSPIAEYKDGNTKVRLDKAGPFYFISGAEGHCEKGQRLIVVVMSERHRRHLGIAPAPSPAEFQGPAIAPTSGATRFQGGLVVVTLVVLAGLGLMW
ncbi:early nodulin-like protein 1 [Camellia sinensis]|uniref:early nodulin-like protein 1 n=1 Tax=Camellia sinensis TaxID=4442 RepID=UPI001036B4F8|nr:early nodulin-like protein 1 [Camellia sinensis]